jgi:hypothetical protein
MSKSNHFQQQRTRSSLRETRLQPFGTATSKMPGLNQMTSVDISIPPIVSSISSINASHAVSLATGVNFLRIQNHRWRHLLWVSVSKMPRLFTDRHLKDWSILDESTCTAATLSQRSLFRNMSIQRFHRVQSIKSWGRSWGLFQVVPSIKPVNGRITRHQKRYTET